MLCASVTNCTDGAQKPDYPVQPTVNCNQYAYGARGAPVVVTVQRPVDPTQRPVGGYPQSQAHPPANRNTVKNDPDKRRKKWMLFVLGNLISVGVVISEILSLSVCFDESEVGEFIRRESSGRLETHRNLFFYLLFSNWRFPMRFFATGKLLMNPLSTEYMFTQGIICFSFPTTVTNNNTEMLTVACFYGSLFSAGTMCSSYKYVSNLNLMRANGVCRHVYRVPSPVFARVPSLILELREPVPNGLC